MKPRLVSSNVKPVPRDVLDPLFAAWLDAGIVDLAAYRRLTQPKPVLRVVEDKQ